MRPMPTRLVMMVKAMVLPMIIREASAVNIRVTTTALSGISQPGRTWKDLAPRNYIGVLETEWLTYDRNSE